MITGRRRALLSLLFAFLALWGGSPPPAAAKSRTKLDPRLQLLQETPPHRRLGLLGTLSADIEQPRPYVEVLILLRPGPGKAYLERVFPQAQFRSQAGEVVTARVPIDLLDALGDDPNILQVQGSRRYAPVMNVVRTSNTLAGLILGVLKNGAIDLAGADGSGVIVGVVDTGINYRHKDFINDAANTSRVLNIWDQTISSDAVAPFPGGFNYGAEYDNSDLTTALQTGGFSLIRSTDLDGHGTHVAGIAAGDGSDTNGLEPAGRYAGMAPKADIIAVKTNFRDGGIVDAMNYIVGRAAALGKKAVINLSLGGQYGPHDGSDPFESSVGAIAANTPVAVAMGNDHADSPHARYNFSASEVSTFTVIPTPFACPASPGSFLDFVETEFWHPSADQYSVTVSLSGGGAGAGSVAAAPGATAIAAIGAATVRIFNSTFTPTNGERTIFVQVQQGPAVSATQVHYRLARLANGGTGRVDGFTQPAILGASFSNFLDAALTMTSPATANNVFAVGAYATKHTWTALDGFDYSLSCPPTLGQVTSFSGRGPTRDGRLKPDIAAPGQVIAASSSTFARSSNTPGIFTLLDGSHTVKSGTSMATPVAAGFIALKLQMTPSASVSDIRSVMQAHARADAAVGAVPNNTWGYGKLLGTPRVLDSPQQVSAKTLGISSITWTWLAVPNASSYTVYYATNTAVFISSVTSTSFTFTNLSANFLTGIFVRGSNSIGEGAGTTGPSTSTLASPPLGPFTLLPHSSSITVSYGLVASCSGYLLTASATADFSGPAFSSSTPNPLLGSLQVSGLNPATTYSLRLASLNQTRGVNFVSAGSTKTLSNLSAPGPAAFSDVATGTIRLNWTQGSNPSNLSYSADASTAADFSGAVLNIQGLNIFSAFFGGLSANTSHFFRVQALPDSPHLNQGPRATLAVAPSSATPAFANVGSGLMRLLWTANNPPGTTFQAQLSTAPDFTGALFSSQTLNAFADIGGLGSNTTYYGRARALGHGGDATAFAVLSATATLALPPAAAAAPFTNQALGGFTVNFTNGGNPPETFFLAEISTAPGFVPLSGSSRTFNTWAAFAGLIGNQTYYFQAAALNHNGVPSVFSAAASTWTLPAPPAASPAPAASQTVSALGLRWESGGNSTATLFTAQIASQPFFGGTILSSITANLFADFAGLLPNTTYQLRVRAMSLGPPNPNGALAVLSELATLAKPPGFLAGPLVSVTYASVTVRWTPLPSSPPDASSETCSGYRIEASTDPAFGGAVFRGGVSGAASFQGGVQGLAPSTTYFLRVGSLNWGEAPNFILLGSTRTRDLNVVTTAMQASGLSLGLSPASPLIKSVTVSLAAGALPAGTPVTLNTSVEFELPPPRSNQARITPMGTGIGFLLSAGGLQPAVAVRAVMVYDPLLLPASGNPKSLMLARYDESAAQWSLLPTFVDTANRQIVAEIDHFSLFAPFFVGAGEDLGGVNVFPVPWEIGAGSGLFAAASLTISNLPSDARVRIFSMTGELVWEGTARANGVLNWSGQNRFGRGAGSGTYLISIEGAGRRLVRRAVVIR